MKVAIRVDASLQIGFGHVMRCLTLAQGLKDMGCEVQFITRNHSGNLNSLIESKGFILFEITNTKSEQIEESQSTLYELSLIHI